jgi:subtilase family serine protease
VIRSKPGHRRSLGTIVAVGIVAAVAMVTAASVSAAGGSASRMSVDPIVSPAGTVDPGYGLFSCQVGLSVGACYDPYQMRNAYDIAPLIAAGNTGSGRTIIILDAFQSPNIVQQLNTYDSFYGLPGLNGLGGPNNPALGTFTQIAPQGLTPFVTGNPEMTGWAEEISLDVLWAHAIAPGANIVLDLATDSSDAALSSALKYAIDHNVGDVVSQSFGESDTCLDTATQNAWHSIYASATTNGVTIFASSGDQGAAQPSCDGSSWIKSTSAPASDPLVTGVGGTELNAAGYCLTQLGCVPANNPSFGTYLSEIAWNEGPPFGDFQNRFGSTLASGGGFSTVWSEPSYQQGTIHGGKQRAVPDVSYSAAVLHGVLTYLNIPGVAPGFYRFGGTSAGSPQWAAITAIADQMAGHDLGFINKALYHIGQAPPHYSAGFHDITSGTNSAVEFDSSGHPVAVTGYNAGTGWDAVTGLGSPIVDQLVPMLIQFTSPGDGVSAINDSKHG